MTASGVENGVLLAEDGAEENDSDLLAFCGVVED